MADTAQPELDEAKRAIASAVERVRAGEPSAYRELVEQCQKPLHRVLVRYCSNPDDAMDLVQRALIRAYERLDRLDDPEKFKPWLFRIGINLALNERRGRRETAALDDVAEPSASPTVEGDILHEQRMVALRAALSDLSPTQRDVVLLRLEGELTYNEIADQVDSTPGAVRVHFHNAVKRLQGLLKALRESQNELPAVGS